jgi:hypothetical protein
MRIFSKILVCILLVSALPLQLGCRKSLSAPPAPTVIPQDLRVGTAWFTQPTSTRELITGRLPEVQGKIGPALLGDLDHILARTLAGHSDRRYVALYAPDHGQSMDYSESGSPLGLQTWLRIGRSADVDLLLVPQVINWQERDGGEIGVARSAAVKVEFYLLDIARSRLLKHAVFEEEQVGLTENLLTLGSFIKRKGRWVSAEELATEAIIQAIREFGL